MATQTLKVTHSDIPMGPYKLRPVCDIVRGQPVTTALTLLRLTPRAAAQVLAKKLQATASASLDHGLDPATLVVKTIYADQQLELKRQRIRSRGRSAIMRKRSSTVTIEVAEGKTRNSKLETRNKSEIPISKSKTKVQA